jgi:hypothetical protein
MGATPTQTINLVVAVGILALSIVGYLALKNKQYLRHGQLMAMAFGMLIVSFLLVMVPSLWANYRTFLDPNTIVFDVASILHVPFGLVGLAAAGVLVTRWGRNDYKISGMKTPLLMRITMVSWVGSVLLGAIIFFTMPS